EPSGWLLAGENSLSLTYNIIPDSEYEQNEAIAVEFDSYFEGLLISSDVCYVEIVDDDPIPSITIADAAPVAEGNLQSTGIADEALCDFTVRLSNPSAFWVSVDYATLDKSAFAANFDYVATHGRLYFAPGETEKHILVSSIGDNTVETNEV